MTDEKRQFVADLYPGARWKRRVAQMSDAQIFAIWVKEQQKKQEPPKKEKNDPPPF
jgi:hypothetical protein